MPVWLKWLAVVIVLITTIGVPVALFEQESDALVSQVVAWSGDRPLVMALVLVVALTSDVLFPVPNGIVNTAAGSLFGWATGALVIWVGLTLGCLLGYGVGKLAGKPLAKRFVGEKDLQAAHDYAERLGAVALVLTRTVPMIGDVATISAGITTYPFRRYLLVTGLANVGVAVVFAGIGSAASDSGSALLAFFGAIILPALAWFGYQLFSKGRREPSQLPRE
ncbi:MAG: TVP38/TMEM64 family protein [Pseudomonadales bacterium]